MFKRVLFLSIMMIRLGLVVIGKIARDQHLPAIRADDRYKLVVTASRHAQVDGVPGHADIAAMIAVDRRLGAVSICTPPVGRHAIAAAAIDAGLHVMPEKPQIGRASCRESECQYV